MAIVDYRHQSNRYANRVQQEREVIARRMPTTQPSRPPQSARRTPGVQPQRGRMSPEQLMERAAQLAGRDVGGFAQQKGAGGSGPGLLSQLGAAAGDVFKGAGLVLGAAQRGVTLGVEQAALGLSEEAEWLLPLTKLVDEERVRADSRSNWEKFGDIEYGMGQITYDTGNGFVDGLTGFGLDVLTDPLTYVTFGTANVMGKAGRHSAAAVLASHGYGDDVVRQVGRYGDMWLDDTARELIGSRDPGLYFGFGRKASVRLPGTGAMGRPVQKGLAHVRANTVGQVTNRVGRLGMGTTPELAQAKRVLDMGRTVDGMTPRIAAGRMWWDSVARMEGGTATDTISRAAESWAKKTRTEARRNAANIEGKPLSALTDQSDRAVRQWFDHAAEVMRTEAGVDIGHVEGYLPHRLSQRGGNWLDNIQGGRQALSQVISTDVIEDATLAKTRTVTAGSVLEIGGKQIVVRDPSIRGLNAAFEEAFPELAEKGIKVFEDDVGILMSRYAQEAGEVIGNAKAWARLTSNPHMDDIVREIDKVPTRALEGKAALDAAKGVQSQWVDSIRQVLKARAASQEKLYRETLDLADEIADQLKTVWTGKVDDISARLGAEGDRIAGLRAALEDGGSLFEASRHFDEVQADLAARVQELEGRAAAAASELEAVKAWAGGTIPSRAEYDQVVNAWADPNRVTPDDVVPDGFTGAQAEAWRRLGAMEEARSRYADESEKVAEALGAVTDLERQVSNAEVAFLKASTEGLSKDDLLAMAQAQGLPTGTIMSRVSRPAEMQSLRDYYRLIDEGVLPADAAQRVSEVVDETAAKAARLDASLEQMHKVLPTNAAEMNEAELIGAMLDSDPVAAHMRAERLWEKAAGDEVARRQALHEVEGRLFTVPTDGGPMPADVALSAPSTKQWDEVRAAAAAHAEAVDREEIAFFAMADWMRRSGDPAVLSDEFRDAFNARLQRRGGRDGRPDVRFPDRDVSLEGEHLSGVHFDLDTEPSGWRFWNDQTGDYVHAERMGLGSDPDKAAAKWVASRAEAEKYLDEAAELGLTSTSDTDMAHYLLTRHIVEVERREAAERLTRAADLRDSAEEAFMRSHAEAAARGEVEEIVGRNFATDPGTDQAVAQALAQASVLHVSSAKHALDVAQNRLDWEGTLYDLVSTPEGKAKAAAWLEDAQQAVTDATIRYEAAMSAAPTHPLMDEWRRTAKLVDSATARRKQWAELATVSAREVVGAPSPGRRGVAASLGFQGSMLEDMTPNQMVAATADRYVATRAKYRDVIARARWEEAVARRARMRSKAPTVDAPLSGYGAVAAEQIDAFDAQADEFLDAPFPSHTQNQIDEILRDENVGVGDEISEQVDDSIFELEIRAAELQHRLEQHPYLSQKWGETPTEHSRLTAEAAAEHVDASTARQASDDLAKKLERRPPRKVEVTERGAGEDVFAKFAGDTAEDPTHAITKTAMDTARRLDRQFDLQVFEFGPMTPAQQVAAAREVPAALRHYADQAAERSADLTARANRVHEAWLGVSGERPRWELDRSTARRGVWADAASTGQLDDDQALAVWRMMERWRNEVRQVNHTFRETRKRVERRWGPHAARGVDPNEYPDAVTLHAWAQAVGLSNAEIATLTEEAAAEGFRGVRAQRWFQRRVQKIAEERHADPHMASAWHNPWVDRYQTSLEDRALVLGGGYDEAAARAQGPVSWDNRLKARRAPSTTSGRVEDAVPDEALRWDEATGDLVYEDAALPPEVHMSLNQLGEIADMDDPEAFADLFYNQQTDWAHLDDLASQGDTEALRAEMGAALGDSRVLSRPEMERIWAESVEQGRDPVEMVGNAILAEAGVEEMSFDGLQDMSEEVLGRIRDGDYLPARFVDTFDPGVEYMKPVTNDDVAQAWVADWVESTGRPASEAPPVDSRWVDDLRNADLEALRVAKEVRDNATKMIDERYKGILDDRNATKGLSRDQWGNINMADELSGKSDKAWFIMPEGSTVRGFDDKVAEPISKGAAQQLVAEKFGNDWGRYVAWVKKNHPRYVPKKATGFDGLQHGAISRALNRKMRERTISDTAMEGAQELAGEGVAPGGAFNQPKMVASRELKNQERRRRARKFWDGLEPRQQARLRAAAAASERSEAAVDFGEVVKLKNQANDLDARLAAARQREETIVKMFGQETEAASRLETLQAQLVNARENLARRQRFVDELLEDGAPQTGIPSVDDLFAPEVKFRDEYVEELDEVIDGAETVGPLAELSLREQREVLDALAVQAADQRTSHLDLLAGQEASISDSEAIASQLRLKRNQVDEMLKAMEKATRPAKKLNKKGTLAESNQQRLNAVGDNFKALIDASDGDPALSAAADMYARYVKQIAELGEQSTYIDEIDQGRHWIQKVAEMDEFPLDDVLEDGWRTIDGQLQRLLPESERYMVSAEWERAMTNIRQSWRNPSAMVRFLEEMNQAFKRWAVATPGFHVRNGISSAFMNFVEGVGPVWHSRAFRFWREMAEAAQDDASWNRWYAGLDDSDRVALKAVMGSGTGGSFDAAELGMETAADSYKRLWRNRVTAKSRQIGVDYVEGPVRMAYAMKKAREGLTDMQIQAGIERIHFNYSKLSQFDRTMKHVIPFWLWMSRNLPMQLETMAKKPKAYATYHHFMMNMTENEEWMPGWMRGIGARRIATLGDGTSLMLAPDLPHVQLGDTAGQFFPNPAALLQGATPYAKVPLELFTNRSFTHGGELNLADKGAVETLKYIAESAVPLASRGSRIADQVSGEASDVESALWWARLAGLPLHDVTEKDRANTRKYGD